MAKSRRQFLTRVSASIAAVTAACRKPVSNAADLPPGAPPAFGTSPEVGPPVSPATFAQAEKLAQVEMSPAERGMAASSWRRSMASVYERRTGPRKLALESTVAPASRWDPVLPGQNAGPQRDRFVRSTPDPAPLPARDEDIAFASVTQLSRWIEKKKNQGCANQSCCCNCLDSKLADPSP